MFDVVSSVPSDLASVRDRVLGFLPDFASLRFCVRARRALEVPGPRSAGIGVGFPVHGSCGAVGTASRSGSGLTPPFIAPYDPVCVGACACKTKPSFMPRLSPCAKPPAPSSGVKASTPYFRLRISVLLVLVTAAHSQHPCHRELFMPHQAISAVVEESARGECRRATTQQGSESTSRLISQRLDLSQHRDISARAKSPHGYTYRLAAPFKGGTGHGRDQTRGFGPERRRRAAVHQLLPSARLHPAPRARL